MVLASESKAHAQARASRKGSRAPSKHIKPSCHVSELSSDHLSSRSVSPAGHSPPDRPSKRVRTAEPQNTTHDHRPVRPLPQQLPIQHADLGLKRKVPGGPTQPKAFGHTSAAGPSHYPASGAPGLHMPLGVNPPPYLSILTCGDRACQQGHHVASLLSHHRASHHRASQHQCIICSLLCTNSLGIASWVTGDTNSHKRNGNSPLSH